MGGRGVEPGDVGVDQQVRIGDRLFEERTDVGGIADVPDLRWQELREGRFPDVLGEVVADVNAVKGLDVTVGDSVEIVRARQGG